MSCPGVQVRGYQVEAGARCGLIPEQVVETDLVGRELKVTSGVCSDHLQEGAALRSAGQAAERS